MPTILSELFPTEIRYTGVSMAFQLANVVCVGFGPLVIVALVGLGGGSPLLPTLLIVVVCLISLLGLWKTVREARGIDLRDV